MASQNRWRSAFRRSPSACISALAIRAASPRPTICAYPNAYRAHGRHRASAPQSVHAAYDARTVHQCLWDRTFCGPRSRADRLSSSPYRVATYPCSEQHRRDKHTTPRHISPIPAISLTTPISLLACMTLTTEVSSASLLQSFRRGRHLHLAPSK